MSIDRPLLLAAAAALLSPSASAQPLPDASRADAELQTINFGFAPPIGTVLRYEHIRTSLLDGQLTGARLVYDYRFDRRDGGYLVWVELTGIEGLGEEQRVRLAETVAAPMLNMRYAIELSPDGVALSIRDEDAVWAATLEGIAHIEAEIRSRPGISDEERNQMLGLLAAIQAQEGDVRRDGMLIVIEDMMTFAGRSIAIGEHPHDGAIASPLGGTVPLDGVMSAELAGEDMAQVGLTGTAITAERFTIREQVQYRAAPSSGLVHRMDRTRAVEAPPASQTSDYNEAISIRLVEEIPVGSQMLPGAN